MSGAPLVSVVMPAWKPRYLPQALESVRQQTHRPLELIVCDDAPQGRVQQLVEAFAAQADFPVRYSRNPERLWETRSTARGVAMAQGEFIKLLHDDDVLHPDCIATLLDAFARVPGLALASSRRRLVDEAGTPLPDELATAFPTRGDLLMDGHDLIDFLADYTLNFIGEPSAVLCRRAPLLALGDQLAVLDGQPIRWVADLALYVKLLRDGPLAMIGKAQVDFRISRDQYSQWGRDRPGIGESGHIRFREALRSLGWRREGRDSRQVTVAPLDGSRQAAPIDLLQAIGQAHALSSAPWRLREWQARRDLNAAQQLLLEMHVAQLPRRATLGIVVTPRADPAALPRTLASLNTPTCLTASMHIRAAVDNAPEIPPQAASFATRDWSAGGYGAALDGATADWAVDWLLVVHAGTEFTKGGLTRLLLALAETAQGTRAIYADQWHRGQDGDAAPVLRPDQPLDLLLGHPAAMAGHWIVRRDAVQAVGGFGAMQPGAEALDLILRLIEDAGLTGIEHLPEPLLYCDPPPTDAEAERAAITRHLHTRGYPDAYAEAAAPGMHRLRYRHRSQPLVSLIVVAQGDPALLQRCVLSILEQTAWPRYELMLVDNGSTPEGRHWMQEVAALMKDRVRVFALDQPMPHAAACNLAATQAAGEFFLFLRAEAAMVQPQWLDALLEHGQRPEVGITGALTVSAEGRITEAGMVPGLSVGDGRAFVGESMQAPGYLGRLKVAHDCAAVSDACLLVGRERFLTLGGFDAEAFPEHGADVDLCLRAAQAGTLVVCTPHALLLHTPPAPQDRQTARDALCERWLPALASDPNYHPALRLDVAGGFRLGESDFSWRPLPWRPLSRVLAHPADAWGSGHYRVLQPLAALEQEGLVEGVAYASLLDPVEQARIDPDVVVLQRRVGEDALERIRRMPRFSRAFKVYELDDYLPNLPAKSAHREHMPRDILRTLRRAMTMVDRVVVSTPALAEAFQGFHPDIRIARNGLPPAWWIGLPAPHRIARPRPRVGWAGGLGHAGDLEIIADVVRELAGEVDWVFLGMCPDRLRPYVAEVHPGVDISIYPRVLARLYLDVAIAPLEQNRFNECKSNLRLLEYGACAIPVICSDVGPYRDERLPVTRVRNRHRDWVNAIRELLADAGGRAAAGDALREVVRRDWMLNGENLTAWRDAWLPGEFGDTAAP